MDVVLQLIGAKSAVTVSMYNAARVRLLDSLDRSRPSPQHLADYS